MEKQKQRSKGAPGETARPAFASEAYTFAGPTEFLGYDTLSAEATVIEVLKDGAFVDELRTGEKGEIILDRTPFYGESGGQAGDKGIMISESARITVLDTRKPVALIHVHHVQVKKGHIAKGENVTGTVDEISRRATMRNHTATHLLHKALKTVLGDHVKQSGSVVDPERLRFDFTHFHASNKDELKKIEDIVNEQILKNLPVRTDIMSTEEAIKSGAVALFDEKYGDTVRVITVGDFSRELCGGTHCKATGEIGLFVVLSEGSVASGIRRIEALTGKNAFEYLRQKKS